MFGENRIGVEYTTAVERAFGYDALPFAEQIGQNSLIGHRNFSLAVGDFKTDAQIIAVHEAAVFDQAAEPDTRTGIDVLFHHVARRIEKHDGVAERIEHERDSNAQHAKPAADQNETSLFAGHYCWFRRILSISLRARDLWQGHRSS